MLDCVAILKGQAKKSSDTILTETRSDNHREDLK